MADPVTKLFGEAWNEGRLEVVGELVAPGFITHAGEDEIRGPEELGRVISSWRQAFPDLLYEVDERVEQGDLVVTRTGHAPRRVRRHPADRKADVVLGHHDLARLRRRNPGVLGHGHGPRDARVPAWRGLRRQQI